MALLSRYYYSTLLLVYSSILFHILAIIVVNYVTLHPGWSAWTCLNTYDLYLKKGERGFLGGMGLSDLFLVM